jgi:hypothetical protein
MQHAGKIVNAGPLVLKLQLNTAATRTFHVPRYHPTLTGIQQHILCQFADNRRNLRLLNRLKPKPA